MKYKIELSEFGKSALHPFSLLSGIVIGAMMGYGILGDPVFFWSMFLTFILIMKLACFKIVRIKNEVRGK